MKLTELQRKEFRSKLRSYCRKYMVKKFLNLDESGTRIMINNLLCDVLDYEELSEIRTEYAIKGSYADYVVQVEKKQHLVVEVKSIQIDINANHIKQATSYAANEGIEWVILTNGKELMLFRVEFEKPLRTKLVFELDFFDKEQFDENAKKLEYLSKKCVTTDELESYWLRHIALTPMNLSNHLYDKDTITCLRRSIKREVGINFDDQEVFEAVHKLVISQLERTKPKFKS